MYTVHVNTIYNGFSRRITSTVGLKWWYMLGEPPSVDERRYNAQGPEFENKMCMRSHDVEVTKRSLMRSPRSKAKTQ